MLDHIWLRSFVLVAEQASFTEAAARLGTRQSTISDHIRKLEARTGRRLLLRDTHSVALTSDGEAMLGFARSILQTQERAMRHFAKEELRGRVRLGISEDVVLSGLTHALRQFVEVHPKIELEMTVGVSEAVRQQLDNGKLDLALVKRHVGETHGDLVWRLPLVWAAAPPFRPKAAGSLPLIVLAPPALTRAIALAALEQMGRPWHIVCSSDSQSGVHAAALAGLGVAPHAKSLLPSGLVPVRDESLPSLGDIEFVLCTRKGARDTLIDALHRTLKRELPRPEHPT